MPAWFNSFRIRLTLLFGGLAFLVTLGLALYIDRVASARIAAASGAALQGMAGNLARDLAASLGERLREVVLLSEMPLLTGGDLTGPALRQSLKRRLESFPAYAWIGVAGPDGRVLAAADGVLQGADVSGRPWFAAGQRGPFLGDVHKAVLLADKSGASAPGDDPPRFVDFAAPLHDGDGRLRGVLAAHARWSWVAGLIRDALAPSARASGVEVFIVSHAGEVLYPREMAQETVIPAALMAHGGFEHARWNDGEDYFAAGAEVPARQAALALGWHVVVRQPVRRALALVGAMHRTLLVLGTVATLLAMFLAYRLATGVSRPVERLAAVAQRIRDGDRAPAFPDAGSVRELRQLQGALQGMTAALIERERALQHINANLERTVAARTEALVAANRELEKLARHDALTGLPNRRAAGERLQLEFLRLRRGAGGFAVLLMDVDHFKRVNDQYGHETGDLVLQAVAALLQHQVRASDLAARFGGEEFLVVLPDTGHEGARVLAGKIRAAVAAATLPQVGQVTVSIGVALAGADDASGEDAVRRADQALYRAKAAGRDRVAD